MKKTLVFLFVLMLTALFFQWEKIDIKQVYSLPSFIRKLVPNNVENKIYNNSEKKIEDVVANLNLTKDPMYRPMSVLENFNHKREDKIERLRGLDFSNEVINFRGGRLSVESCIFTSACHILSLNNSPIFKGEFIEIIGAFRKSAIDLVFFTEDCSGSSCGFPSIYLIRYIDGLGYGIEDLGYFHGSFADNFNFSEKIKVLNDKIVIDLGRDDLMNKTIAITPEGGVIDVSTPLPIEPMEQKSCDLLFSLLSQYLEKYNAGGDFPYKDIHDYINEKFICNACQGNISYIKKTQTGYSSVAYKAISEIVLKRKTMPSKDLFCRKVCGWVSYP